MGLGKTVTLIALHLHRAASRRRPGPTLVVCPASLLGNWEAEIHRFAPGVAGPPLPRRRARPRRARRRAARRVRAHHLRHDAASTPRRLGRRALGPRRRRRGPARQERPLLHRAGAAHASPAAARVALTGTPVENNLTELWAILDWAHAGAARQPQRLPQGVGRARSSRASSPPRRASSPTWSGRSCCGAASPTPASRPSCRPRPRPTTCSALTREQVVLYEAFVRDTMERIERADEETRRGLVLALLTGLKQICNHPAHFLKQSGRSARAAARRSSTCSTSCSARSSPRTARCWSSPSTSRWPGCSSRT